MTGLHRNEVRALPVGVQKLAVRNYRLWCQNRNHPSLRFRLLQDSKNRFTIRIGDHYRAVGRLDSATITWVWIGSPEYDQLVCSM